MSTPLPDLAWDWLLLAEGGYSNAKADPGGRTQYGIAEKSHPEAWANGPPTEADARAIYSRHYWEAYHCGDLPLRLGLMLLDLVVQHPPAVAVRLWQQCIVAHPVDGILGPETRRKGQKADAAQVMDAYFPTRALHYAQLVSGNSSFAPFLRGWQARLFRLQRYLLMRTR